MMVSPSSGLDGIALNVQTVIGDVKKAAQSTNPHRRKERKERSIAGSKCKDHFDEAK